MCRCVAAIARAVVAFLDAVLVGCLLSCFRPRPRHGSGRRVSRAPPDPPPPDSLALISLPRADDHFGVLVQDALAPRDRAAGVLDDERGIAFFFFGRLPVMLWICGCFMFLLLHCGRFGKEWEIT